MKSSQRFVASSTTDISCVMALSTIEIQTTDIKIDHGFHGPYQMSNVLNI